MVSNGLVVVRGRYSIYSPVRGEILALSRKAVAIAVRMAFVNLLVDIARRLYRDLYDRKRSHLTAESIDKITRSVIRERLGR